MTSLSGELKQWGADHPESPVAGNVPLSELTTFRIGGPAQMLVSVYNEEHLADLIDLLDCQNLPFYLLGGGSNILFSDLGFRGAVLKLGACFEQVVIAGTKIFAGAGARTSYVMKLAQQNGLTGLEPLVGLPGTIGGAIKCNAGGRYGDIGDLVEKVKVLTAGREFVSLTRSQLKFGYRSLDMGLADGIILEAELSLNRGHPEDIRSRTGRSLAMRANQPVGSSAGCIFRNPQQPPFGRSYTDDAGRYVEPEILSAGQLIDLCGLKGRTLGGSQISPKHANFIVNLGGSRASDVMFLVSEIKRAVLCRFGLALHMEIKCPAAGGRENG
ncbi:MAG: UDP-N-acetylmuramate dehydrogenase [Deltaproteobacteria bacterium]|nr:UDP-N-acetylmuramate dehydrogenase [Deltaproteobacteria bacterium]